MSVLTATLSTTWLFEQESSPMIWAVPRPTNSRKHAATARKTRDFVRNRRLRRLLGLLWGVVGAVTVSLDRRPGCKRAPGQAILANFGGSDLRTTRIGAAT